MEEEQVYTIPLRNARKSSRKNRSARSIRIIKEFMKRHTDANEVKISSDLNEKIWDRGAEKPPAKVRVRAAITAEGVVEVSSLE